MVTVTARVQEHVRVRFVAHPTHVDITEEDVRRRWVDVPSPLKIEVTSNLPSGLDMHFESSSLAVRGASTLSPLATTPRRGAGMEREMIEVRLRLELADGARPGRHAWPIQVTFAPR